MKLKLLQIMVDAILMKEKGYIWVIGEMAQKLVEADSLKKMEPATRVSFKKVSKKEKANSGGVPLVCDMREISKTMSLMVIMAVFFSLMVLVGSVLLTTV